VIRAHIVNLLIIILPVAFPNILFVFFPPKDVPVSHTEKKKFFAVALLCERIGQVSIFVLPVFYTFDVTENRQKVLLLMMILSLAVYYIGWIRFLAKGREYALLYSPLVFIPIPLAISPLVYFACAAILMKSFLFAAALVLLAAGHVPISYREFRRTLS
jgi:hypothetical protein